MLSKPKGGWSDITIGNWSDRCSYVDDIPFNLLKAMEQSCREHKPVSVNVDAEGYEYIIIFDWFHTHIILENIDEEDKSDFKYFSIRIDRDKLAKELISDIRRDIDGWSNWLSYHDMSEDEISERKKDLLVLCEVIENRLPSDDYELIYVKK